ncbi:S8 family peptidase [Chitinibacter sp. S2-10]|uniref:S8 family peptidase n=1 Tax=Chitinibacter sp. S2-10 TaxID=3373597 RepID=UPI003977D44A
MKALFLLLATLGSGVVVAAPPSETSDVIVIFHNNTTSTRFHGLAKADERMAANPEAWNYLDQGLLGVVQKLESHHQFKANHVFSYATRGFAARLNKSQIDALRLDKSVAYIEPDQPVSIIAQTLPWGIDRIGADQSWTLAGNGSGSVSGINVYVIDTGVYAHPDLNLVRHVNFAGGQNADCNGHGTHVAGTIAAKDNDAYVVGVAPGLPLTGVKVLGCNGSGSMSGVIKGVDWVTANAVRPAIANMSLGGGVSQALDDAIVRSANLGVFYALAAGNSGANACNSSPARVGGNINNGIVTTAATDSADKEASWSNYGPCVDIWAPGVSILSTKLKGGVTTMSGTSMASPHTAGAAALYWATWSQWSNEASATPQEIEYKLKLEAFKLSTTSKDGRLINLLNTVPLP